MKRRKVMSLALAIALAIGTTAGCGGKKTAEPPAATTDNGKVQTEKKVIRVAWWGSQDRADKTTKVCEMYMKEHPDVEIQVEFS